MFLLNPQKYKQTNLFYLLAFILQKNKSLLKTRPAKQCTSVNTVDPDGGITRYFDFSLKVC